MTLPTRVATALALALLLLTGIAFGVWRWTGGGDSLPPNSPAAQALYWRALTQMAAQPRFQIDESFRQVLPPSMTPMHTGGVTTATYRIRHVAPDWLDTSVTRMTMVGGNDIELFLHGRTLCIGLAPGAGFPWGTVCTPTHPYSVPGYINKYLLGGQVDHLRYSSKVLNARIVLIVVSARGALGCTPAGAGAGVKSGYHWCEPSDIPGNPRVSATLLVNRRTGLPFRFSGGGTRYGKPSNVSASFRYGGTFRIRLPKVIQKGQCTSWIPAIHCIELGRHKGKSP